MDKEKELEKVSEKLIEKLRENTTNDEFLNFAFHWLGEDFIMELLENSINSYEDLEVLKDSLKSLERGDFELATDKY